MLTVQALRLMDIIWKNEGLDLRLLTYDCFSTGNNLGFIEVVKNSITIFKVQTESGKLGKYQIDLNNLFKWIQVNNPGQK
jgi:phosphatidylinositol kinase/protein kinase (PI-3  family)